MRTFLNVLKLKLPIEAFESCTSAFTFYASASSSIRMMIENALKMISSIGYEIAIINI